MKKILLAALVLFTTGQMLFAQEPLRKKHYNIEKSLGIDGYDPVAYFKQNKAVEGSKSIAATYQGVTYYFASAENRSSFLASPGSFEPQYGGWCAYAMGAKGEKVTVDPETFKILNGKLYLFYNKYFNNTLKDWNKDEKNLLQKANLNWQKTFL
jgi:YHS domain-containing protein